MHLSNTSGTFSVPPSPTEPVVETERKGDDQPQTSTRRKSFIQRQIEVFEEVLDLLGGFGKFQLLILILILSLEVPATFVMFIPIFVSGKSSAEWTCDNLTIAAEDICSCNETLRGITSSSIMDNIMVEWSLTCESAWVADFITTIQMFGMFFGNVYGSQFADWYGRRKSFLVSTLLLALGSSVSAVAPNPIIYTIARLLCGAGYPAFLNTACMSVIEFMPPKWRSLSNSIGPTGEGIMILSVLAYFIRPWRTLYWVTAAPFALIIFIYPFVPESARWLLRNDRVEDAEAVLKYMAKVNGCEPVDIRVLQKISEQERITREESNGSKRIGYIEFLKDAQLRKTCLFMCSIWFSWSSTYYGVSYNIKNVPGNIYLNVFLLGLANAIGQRAALLINDRFGRRRSLFASMTFCAVFLVALAICVILMEKGSVVLGVVTITFCMLSQFGIASARSSARLLSGESFPTPVRTMGLGLGGVAANIAGVVTPQLAYLGSQWPSIPFFIFAVVSVAGSLVAFLMQETTGKPLSDAMTKKCDQISSPDIKSISKSPENESNCNTDQDSSSNLNK